MKTSTIVMIAVAVLVVGGACIGIPLSGVLNDTSGTQGNDPVQPTETPVEPTPTETPTTTPTSTPMSYFSGGGSKSDSGSSSVTPTTPTPTPTPTPCTHVWSTAYTSNDDGTHYQVCTLCEEETEAETCTYEKYDLVEGEDKHSISCKLCGHVLKTEGCSYTATYDEGTSVLTETCDFCESSKTYEDVSVSVTGGEGATTYYSALPAAIAAAKDDQTVTLLRTTGWENVIVEIPDYTKNIILDGNGATISHIDIKPMVHKLTFKNLTLSADYPTSFGSHPVKFNQTGTIQSLTFEKCNFVDTDNTEIGYAIHAQSNNELYASGITDIAKPDLVVKDCTFNTFEYAVYSSFQSLGTITVEGCTFTNLNNWCLSLQNNQKDIGDVSITNCKFINCAAGVIDNNGLKVTSTLTITYNTFENCGTNTNKNLIKKSDSCSCIIYGNTYINTRETYYTPFEQTS